MKRLLFITSLMAAGAAMAVNPVVSTKFTADPAPYVHGDTVYLYTTHDEDDAEGFKMQDWLLYTSTDMVNWTDHGAVASLKDMKWYENDNGAWAEQVIERNGKWYMYCPIHGSGITVLVAESPYGPFVDVLGHPLVWQKEHWYDIDPTVFIDDNGQAYMYWGNPHLYYVKLNRDMISYSGGIVKCDHIDDYQEGPWMFKRGDNYYMAFASTCCPEGIGYAMSYSPEGPWRAKGDIMPHTERSRGNHPGIIEYKGKWYVFGLNYDLLKDYLKSQGKDFEHSERRSVSVAELTFRPDGTIVPVDYWSEGVEQIGSLNPYDGVEAETMAKARWVKTSKVDGKGIVVDNIHNGDYILVKGVDFGSRPASFCADAMAVNGGNIELHIDAIDGQLVSTCKVNGKNGIWRDYTSKIQGLDGVHDLYLVFTGAPDAELLQFNKWKIQ